MREEQYKPGDKVLEITEGSIGVVQDMEPIDIPGLEHALVPVLWDHGHIVYTHTDYLATAAP